MWTFNRKGLVGNVLYSFHSIKKKASWKWSSTFIFETLRFKLLLFCNGWHCCVSSLIVGDSQTRSQSHNEGNPFKTITISQLWIVGNVLWHTSSLCYYCLVMVGIDCLRAKACIFFNLVFKRVPRQFSLTSS